MPDRPDRLQARLRTAFVLLVLAGAVFIVWSAGGFRTAARLFPQYAGGVAIALCLAELGRQFVRRRVVAPDEGPGTADIGLEVEERGLAGMLRGLTVFGWIIGYGAMILVAGMPWATAAFVPLLLHLRYRSDWRATLGIAVGLLALMWTLRAVLDLRWPAGLLGLPF